VSNRKINKEKKMVKKIVLLVMVILLVMLSTEIYAQGTNSNWRAPPMPQWWRNLSQTEQTALLEIGLSSWITNIVISPGNVRIETRRIIDEHGLAWAYSEDDQNIFSIIMRLNGQYRQVMISRYWLNNLR
jgi:hypothetical protein